MTHSLVAPLQLLSRKAMMAGVAVIVAVGLVAAPLAMTATRADAYMYDHHFIPNGVQHPRTYINVYILEAYFCHSNDYTNLCFSEGMLRDQPEAAAKAYWAAWVYMNMSPLSRALRDYYSQIFQFYLAYFNITWAVMSSTARGLVCIAAGERLKPIGVVGCWVADTWSTAAHAS